MQKCINEHMCYIFSSSRIADVTYMVFITSASFIALGNMCAKWCQCRKRDCVEITAQPWQSLKYVFHNHSFCTPDISLNKQNMVLLCSTVGRGSLFFTLLAAALYVIPVACRGWFGVGLCWDIGMFQAIIYISSEQSASKNVIIEKQQNKILLTILSWFDLGVTLK